MTLIPDHLRRLDRSEVTPLTDPVTTAQPITPPGSKTLIYAPKIRVVIASGGREIDVSKDVIRGRVIRAVDAVSEAELFLNNKNGKYTGRLRRMDKIVIWMKRVNWIQVFTGYLDVVPAYDLFPTEARIKASCTLKRVKYTYWDRGLPASQKLLSPVFIGDDGTYQISQDSPDAGTGIIIHDLLTKVANWPANQVLIQQIPVKFMDFMKDNIQLVDQQEVLNRLENFLGVGGVAEGYVYPWTSTQGSIPKPTGTSGKYTQNQVISLIKGIWGDLSSGVSETKIELAAAYALKISGGDPHYHKSVDGRDQWGLFGLDHKGTTGKNLSIDQLKEPMANIKQAYIASAQGTNWSYWSNTLDLGNPPSTLASVKQNAPTVAAWQSGTGTTTATNNPAVNMASDVLQQLFSRFYGANFVGGGGANGTGSEQVQTALNFGLAQVGKPYVLGQAGPNTWDCSGLVVGMFKTVGVNLPHNAEEQARKTFAYQVPKGSGNRWTINDLAPGDVVFFPGSTQTRGGGGGGVPPIGHVGVYLGADKFLEAGDPVQVGSMHGRLSGAAGFADTANFITRPINMVGALSDDTNTWQNTNENGGVDAAYRLFNILYKPQVSDLSLLLRDDFAPANDESLLTSISQVCSGSLRSFMSGPNGDFIAFFPDYFGINQTRAVWNVEDVEIVNLKLEINDDELVTHVFTIGDTNAPNGGVDIGDWVASSGAVSIKSKAIMDQVLSMQSNTGFLANPEAFLQRFGIRPMQNQLSIIRSHYYEFFSSLYTFLQQWSKQFSTDVQICFMPEVFPGMRLNLVNHDVCVYVESVIHTFDYQEGFATYPTISCPSTPAGGSDGLPIAMGI